MKKVFITGGAGFIGSKLVKALGSSCEICVFDNLHPQVHGVDAKYLHRKEHIFIMGDVVNFDSLSKAISGFDPDYIFHLAAETGTGQSYDLVRRYNNVNVMGTANLVEAIKLNKSTKLSKVILASSRAVYGEGPYKNSCGEVVSVKNRKEENLQKGIFEVIDSEGLAMTPLKSDSKCPVSPCSIYGATKLMQEYIITQASIGSSWSSSVLRFQNVYGPGQSLSNPYTGVLSIFNNILLNGGSLNVFEDGNIVRDFVYVDDVVSALISTLESFELDYPVDIGSGIPVTILDVAEQLCEILGMEKTLQITGDYRIGDIRYALANTEPAKKLLKWEPKISIRDGLEELASWSKLQVNMEGVE